VDVQSTAIPHGRRRRSDGGPEEVKYSLWMCPKAFWDFPGLAAVVSKGLADDAFKDTPTSELIFVPAAETN